MRWVSRCVPPTKKRRSGDLLEPNILESVWEFERVRANRGEKTNNEAARIDWRGGLNHADDLVLVEQYETAGGDGAGGEPGRAAGRGSGDQAGWVTAQRWGRTLFME